MAFNLTILCSWAIKGFIKGVLMRLLVLAVVALLACGLAGAGEGEGGGDGNGSAKGRWEKPEVVSGNEGNLVPLEVESRAKIAGDQSN
jgi:hypothetical protein